MKLRLMPVLLAICVMAASTQFAAPAQAGGYWKHDRGTHGRHHQSRHGYWKHQSGYQYGYRRHRYKSRDRFDRGDLLLGLGAFAGGLVVGSALGSSHHSYRPSPVAQTCFQDEVYRWLPDGRIQWGLRARCY